MKKNISAAVLATALLTTINHNAFAGTFSDNFSGGLNPAYWSVSESTPSLYSVNTPGSSVDLSKAGLAGGFQWVSIVLNLGALGGNVSGDFSEQINFANAVIGPNNDQVALNTGYADSSVFDVVYDLSSGLNAHVWNNSVNNPNPVSATSGTFTISRTGSTLTGYFDGTALFSESESSALDSVTFSLDNQPNAAGDSPSVSFGNFSLTASSVPEPTTLALGGLGGLASLVAFRRRK